MRSVLFVCAANICRSPLAMGLLWGKVGPELNKWRIQSAGIWAEDGRPPAQNTQLVLKERGIDISDYRSRQLTEEMLESYNLVLTMERGQKEALRAAFPEYASRIFLLTEMVCKYYDVVDPVGRSMMDFEHTAQEIEQILSEGFELIQTLAKS